MWKQWGICRGYIDDMARVDEELRVHGRMVHPTGPFGTIELVVDGAVSRFAGARHSRRLFGSGDVSDPEGASLRVRFSISATRARGRIAIIGRRGLTVRGRMQNAYRVDLETAFPSPRPTS